MPYLRISLTLLVLMLTPPLRADVVSSSDTHYVLRLEARADVPPAGLWERLVNPAAWWSADHSYSGDAANLTLDVGAGGLWKETWGNNSVTHGQVLTAMEGRLLRLEAPFGPLQAKGAYVIWTITLKPDGEGTIVVFDEVAHAPVGSNMTELAAAVHGVKEAAIHSLTRPKDSP